MNNKSSLEHIESSIVLMKAGILAFVMAVCCGSLIFIMTAWLLIKGGPYPGYHLQLLGEFFVGYKVTWPGALIGFCYGALTGGLAGWAIGIIYNRVARARFHKSS